MNILNSLEWRYATKKFDLSKKLSNHQIDILKNAFNLTATSFGLQPIKLLVINNKELQEKFIELSYYQRQVADASHLLVICIETDISKESIINYFDLEMQLRGTSEKIIEKFRAQLIEMYQDKTIEQKQQDAKLQAYIALGNLLTVCALEKIDSCPMEGFISENVDNLLNLKTQNLKSVLLLPVGYRAEDDFMSKLKKVRKPLAQIVLDID